MLAALFALAVSSTVSPSYEALHAATRALEDFRPQEALALLERAAREDRFDYAHHVQLEEQRGIALAYLGKNEAATAAFGRLLALDPGHAVSYTLSPKATFLFERAREQAHAIGAPALELSWPPGLSVSEPVPIDVEVAADPLAWFARATLYYRLRGEKKYSSVEFELPRPGTRARASIPAAGGDRATSLELYLVAADARGNEVFLWHSPAKPRDLSLAYEPGDSWYSHWWTWAIIGGAAAAAGVGIAVAASHSPDRFVEGEFRSR